MSLHRRQSPLPTPASDRPWSDVLRIAASGAVTAEDIEEWKDRARQERVRRERNPALVRQHVVYYVRFQDRIKIGYSGNVHARLNALPHDEVLALEIGGRDVERMRHEQFDHLNVHGEWFHAAPELLDHAARIREEYPWDL